MKRFYILILSLMLFISGIGFISHSATYISTSQKEVIRDSKRLNDLTIFRKAIEDYKTKNGFYPKLETGTNIKGYVNSVWGTQWTSFCSLIGLTSCPIDPVNEIVGCDCSVFGVCTGDNIDSNINKAACYNSKAQSFACTVDSNLYQYQSLNNGRNYSLMMEFEYSDNVNWNVDSSALDNYIVVKDSCRVGSTLQAKILSNATPKCGDGILNYSEVCEVGSKKMEFCNIDNKLGRKVINCTSDCKWEATSTSGCIIGKFCGDTVVDAGEECDGGFQKMCYNFDNNSKHNWYNEQLRYCTLGCKWNKAFIDSTAYCGGYCGDNIVQSQNGEECDNVNEKHCNKDSCKYENSAPVINFDFYNDRLSKNSYIKSDVWSGDKLQNQNHYYNSNFVDLIIASKQSNKYVAIWNSSFIEIKAGASDKNNDILKYKYSVTSAYNSNILLKYEETPNNWVEYNPNNYITSDVVRIYPKNISGGNNLKNTLDISNPYNGNLLFGPSFVGSYVINVIVTDGYSLGLQSITNPHNSSTTYDVKFNIGAGCGDRILQKDLGEVCEWRPGITINSMMLDWGTYLDSTNRRFKQPDNGGDCVVQIFQNKVGSLTFNYPGKVDDVSCDAQYYGICEKRIHLGCDSSWIKGAEDNCYKLTSKAETWQEAYNECASNDSRLIAYSDTKESDFIKNQSVFSSKNITWIGYNKENGLWNETTGIKMNVIKPNVGSGIFSASIFDGGLGSSYSDEYYCGLPWDFNACVDDRGYCGDGTSNPQFKSCEPSSEDYPYYNKDVSVLAYGASDSSLMTQYFCPNPNGKYGKTKLCQSFNGYCGDGAIQYDLNVENPDTQKGTHETNSIIVNKTHPEQCDPNGHSATAKESSINNTYTCGSFETSDACLDLVYSKKDLDNNYGGYCGDGFVQYDLKSIGLENLLVNQTIFKDTVGGNPEQCDPKNYSVEMNNTSINNQYVCGAIGTDNACKDTSGYCGDGIMQEQFGEICVNTAVDSKTVVNNGSVLSGRTNLTCTSICGTTGDGWTCDAGYYWNSINYGAGSQYICRAVPANATIIGTLHGGEEYQCNERFEKDGIGGCKACNPGYFSVAGGVCTACMTVTNSNWTSNGTNKDNCEFNCKGSFAYNGTSRTCASCTSGKWNPEANKLTTCSDCTAITNMSAWISNGTSAVNCQFNCKERYSYNVSNRTCNTCAIGTWAAEGNQTVTCPVCTNKPANSSYTSNGNGISNCTWSCDTNYYLSGNACILRNCNDDTTDYTAWANTGICNANSQWNNTRSRTATNCQDVQAKTTTSGSCWYCGYPNTASDITQCNSRGTVYTYCQSNYTWNGWQFPCACNVGYFGNNCESTCTYGAWQNYDCQSNSVWAAYRDRTNGNDTQCPRQYNSNNGACWYCNNPAGTNVYNAAVRDASCSSAGVYYNQYYCSGSSHYVYYGNATGCTCDNNRYGGACEATCTYGGWNVYQKDCQSNNLMYAWYYRNIVGSNCGDAYTTSGYTGAACTYCTTPAGNCGNGWTCGCYCADYCGNGCGSKWVGCERGCHTCYNTCSASHTCP